MTNLVDIDWKIYEANVVAAVRAAIDQYASHDDAEPVFEIAIVTVAQARSTTIYLETRDHAREHIDYMLKMARKNRWKEDVGRLSKETVNGSPADFKYRDFLTVEHSELAALDNVDFSEHEQSVKVDALIETHLLAARDTMIAEILFESLPHGDELWVAVNSPEDWFDHVINVLDITGGS